MAINFPNLIHEIRDIATVEESTQRLLHRIADELRLSADDPKAIQELASDLDANSNLLGLAVVSTPDS